MSEAQDRIVGLRIVARNNYTCRNEQNIVTLETRSGLAITQGLAARYLDLTRDERVSRIGSSGDGAGARLLATLNVPDGEEEEEIDSLDHPLVQALPVGDLKPLRAHLRNQRGSTVWNGNNHVPASTEFGSRLLARIRRV